MPEPTLDDWEPCPHSKGSWYPVTCQECDDAWPGTHMIRRVMSEPTPAMSNMGTMTRSDVEQFAASVLGCMSLEAYRMEWTTGGSIFIKPVIYIDERDVEQVKWRVKEIVLHEVAHALSDEDRQHGEQFYRAYIQLLQTFMVLEVSYARANAV